MTQLLHRAGKPSDGRIVCVRCGLVLFDDPDHREFLKLQFNGGDAAIFYPYHEGDPVVVGPGFRALSLGRGTPDCSPLVHQRVEDTSETLERVDPADVAQALGAEEVK